MTGSVGQSELARQLGAELRKHRLARGMSLRALAQRIGLSGHATLIDYEHGRRLPPRDLLVACENALEVRDGSLRELHTRVLAERAERKATELLAGNGASPTSAPTNSSGSPTVNGHRESPSPDPAGTSWVPATRRRAPRVPYLAVIGLAVLVCMIASLVIFRGAASSKSLANAKTRATASPSPVRMGFENGANRWWVLYGGQVAKIEVTSSIAYEGRDAMLVRVSGASAAKGYSAVGISHDVSTLRPGMKVTLELWVPGPQEAGVAFLVHDSRGKNHWAVENQAAGDQETETPLSTHAGWSTFTWTIPPVDAVTTIGMQIWTENNDAVIVGIDGVRW